MKIAEGAGANCEIKGASGERGCWQFMPGMFEQLSKEIVGEILPFTRINEEYVVTKHVQKLLNKGFTAKEIALKWNAGPAAISCSKGVNKYGVAYDSCGHVQKVVKALINI